MRKEGRLYRTLLPKRLSEAIRFYLSQLPREINEGWRDKATCPELQEDTFDLGWERAGEVISQTTSHSTKTEGVLAPEF